MAERDVTQKRPENQHPPSKRSGWGPRRLEVFDPENARPMWSDFVATGMPLDTYWESRDQNWEAQNCWEGMIWITIVNVNKGHYLQPTLTNTDWDQFSCFLCYLLVVDWFHHVANWIRTWTWLFPIAMLGMYCTFLSRAFLDFFYMFMFYTHAWQIGMQTPNWPTFVWG